MMKIGDMIFRHTNLPPDESSAGRNGVYIWRDLWTEPSVCNRPVTGSHGFGSSHRLEQCCLWLAALHCHRMGNVEAPLSHHLLLAVGRQTSQKGDTPFHCHLCQIHPRIAFKEFLPPCFRWILTFSYCLYDFLRDRRIASYGQGRLFSRTDQMGEIGHFFARQSRCQGTMGCQASRHICDDDVHSG